MKYIVFLLFFNCSFVSSQIIKGTVTDSENEVVGNANVLIKKAINPNLIYQFTSTDENGFFSIKLPVYLDSLIVEVTSISHNSDKNTILNIKKEDYPLQIDFILQKRTTSLQEVVIKVKEKPIKVKDDTITYNPNSFKDGTERVIEDLLKKLPGIKVESNGEIKFKGKSIKKMLLDGDDLFDSQYVVGSKNIDIEMVESIQGIENFNENNLLKGINDSDEVALNIKLKKGKTDFSGTAKIGYGVIDKYDSSVTGLLVNSKNKSFGIIGLNNIGINNSPYNFQSEIVSVENLKEESLFSKDIIRQGNFYSQLDEQRANLNDNTYSNFNILHKFIKKVTSKVNLNFYNDKLSKNNSTFSQYALPNNSFIVSEKEILEKKPKIFSGNIQLLNKESIRSNWEYLGKVKYQDIDFRSISTNNNEIQSNNVKSSIFFTKHNLNFTTLINKKNALVSSILYSKSNSPQKYISSPGTAIDDNAVPPIIENNQTSNFKKEVFNLKLELLTAINEFKFVIQTGFNSEKNDYNSSLKFLDSNNNQHTNNSFNNDLTYSITYPFANISMRYKKGNYSFKVSIGTQYYQLQLKDKISEALTQKNELILNPNLKFSYKFSNKSILIAGYDYNQVAPRENNLYNGFVQTNYRSFQNNENSITFLKTHNYSLLFNYNDFFNLRRFQTILNCNIKDNNYFNKTQINQASSTITTFLSDTPSKNYSIMIAGENYIHFIRSTLQINSNYDISFYNDIVNNSNLREIENKNLVIDLSLRTGFKSLINLETKSIYMNTVFSMKDNSKNQLNSLNQNLKVICKTKKNTIASTTINFLSNDLSVNSNYLFVDCELTFTSKNKKIDYSVLARNLTNNKTFKTTSITDYYRSVSSENLINRYFMGVITFKL